MLVVASHYLWRYGYYGEWLPNTYYAKHVRPWYEMGVVYLYAAALETGLYLLLPLAAVSLVQGWRRRRCLAYALPLLCIVLHMAYVARVGGDHFEYRPLDFYWPLLAIPAAEGVVHVGLWVSGVLRRLRPLASLRAEAVARTCAVALFLPVLFYSSAMQGAFLFEDAGIYKKITLDEENAGWLLAAPGMPALVGMSVDAHELMRRTAINSRTARHAWHNATRIRLWSPYGNMERGVVPDDAVAFVYAAGIQPYYVADLKFIDGHGLTDATIGRTPVTHPNSERRMAHDRRPPPGYLAERGVNFAVRPAAASVEQALERATYAVQVGPDLWMPFEAPDPEWVQARFETFAYDTEADGRFEKALDDARLLISARFDVWLDGNRLLYVKDRCDVFEERFFLHVVPADPDDLPEGRRKYGFDNLDFKYPKARLGVTRRCVVAQRLPDYPVAIIRTGQLQRMGRGRHGQLWERLWGEEFRFDFPGR